MPQRKGRAKKPGASTDLPVSGDAIAVLDKVRELREAMNKMPLAAQGVEADAAPGGRSGIDVSNDLEKDINIDAPINNNAACSITHNSNITITYYNFESVDDEMAVSGNMKRYGVWLPEPYVTALDKLRVAADKDRNELAKIAYAPLLERFGIKVAGPEKGKHGTSRRG